MASFYGSEGRVAVAEEGVYPNKDSVFPTTGFRSVELTAENVGIEQNFVSLQTIRGTNVPADEVPTTLRTTGDGIGVVYAPENGIGRIIKGAFGTHTVYAGVYVPKESLGYSDGSTTIFTAANAPANASAPEKVFLDGILVNAGDYTWDDVNAKVTFDTAPVRTVLLAATAPLATMSITSQPVGKAWIELKVTAGTTPINGTVSVTGTRNGVRNITETIAVVVPVSTTSNFYLAGRFTAINDGGINASGIIVGDTETIEIAHVQEIKLSYFRTLSGLYSHVFEEAGPGQALPSFAMTEDRVVPGGVYGWNGCMYGELSMAVNTDGFIVGDASAIGMREFTTTEDDITYPAGLTYSPLKPFIFKGANLFLDGVLNVDMETFEWSMNNNIEGRATISRTDYITKIRRGTREIEVNFSRLFEDMEIYMAFKKAADISIMMDCIGEEVSTIPGEYYRLIVEMPKLRLTEDTPGLDATAEAVEEPTAKALQDPYEGYAIRLVVVNTEATI